MRIELEIPLSLREISVAANGKHSCHNKTVYAITTHSKMVKPNDLFIALKGELSSGEFYVDEAREKGAIILSQNQTLADIYCTDTRIALLNIAKLYKSKLKNLKTTVAITGSVGKTTTKNITAAMLAQKYKVHSTSGNFNNSIGVAYTLLSAPKNTEALVLELGMNHKGEISELSHAANPDISVITNIGTAHIGYLGTKENIANAKLEILDGMKYPILIAPFEESLLKKVKNLYTYSLINSATDCFIDVIKENSDSSVFDVHTNSFYLKSRTVSLAGRHILNAVACGISVMDLLKTEPELIERGIASLNDYCIRQKIIPISDFFLYDDSYNSSPEAVIAAFQSPVFKDRPHSCVLGDMLELGIESERLHTKIGEAAVKYGFEKIYAFGNYSDCIARGAVNNGLNPNDVFVYKDTDDFKKIADSIMRHHTRNEIILLKASHALRADRIKDELQNMITK